MSHVGEWTGETGGIRAKLHRMAYGEDNRIRATWRVLLAIPIFFVFAVTWGSITQILNEALGIFAPLIGCFVAAVVVTVLAFVVWIRRLDRRSLDEYGIHFAPSAVVELIGGFVLVLAGFAFWAGIGALGGWFSIEMTMSYSSGSLPIAVGIALVTLIFSAFPQALWYCGLIFENSKEGIQSRINDERWGTIVAIVIASFLFVAFHLPGTDFSFAVGALLRLSVIIYALVVYIHTDSLFFVTGTHAAVASGQAMIFARPAYINSTMEWPVLFTVNNVAGLSNLITLVPFVPLLFAYVVLRVFIAVGDDTLRLDSAIWT
ncbi:MAG: hypothetical protein ABEI86_14385 [Halobacteriaceae archaeon]